MASKLWILALALVVGSCSGAGGVATSYLDQGPEFVRETVGGAVHSRGVCVS